MIYRGEEGNNRGATGQLIHHRAEARLSRADTAESALDKIRSPTPTAKWRRNGPAGVLLLFRPLFGVPLPPPSQ